MPHCSAKNNAHLHAGKQCSIIKAREAKALCSVLHNRLRRKTLPLKMFLTSKKFCDMPLKELNFSGVSGQAFLKSQHMKHPEIILFLLS